MGILDMFKKKDNEPAKAPEANIEVNNQVPVIDQNVTAEAQQQVLQTSVPAATPVTSPIESTAAPVVPEIKSVTPDSSIPQTVGVTTNNMIQSNPFMEVPSTSGVQMPIQQPIQPNLENVFNATAADLNATAATSLQQVTPIEPQIGQQSALEQVQVNPNLTAEVPINAETPAIDLNQQANFVTPTPVPVAKEPVLPVDTPLAPVIDPTLNMEQPALQNVALSTEPTQVDEVVNINPMTDDIKPIEAEKNNAQDIIPVVEDTAALIDNPQPIASPGADLNVDLIDVFEGGENVTKEDEITNIVTEAVAAEEQAESQDITPNIVPEAEIKEETPVAEVQPTQTITEEPNINTASIAQHPGIAIPDIHVENNVEIAPAVSITENIVANTPTEQVETPIVVETPEIQPEVVIPVEVAPIDTSSESATVSQVNEIPATSIKDTPIIPVTEEVNSNIENVVPTPLTSVEQVVAPEITEVPTQENVLAEVVSEKSASPAEEISVPETPIVLAETQKIQQEIVAQPEVSPAIAPTEAVENPVINEAVSVPLEEPLEVTPPVEAVFPVEVAPIEISFETAVVPPISQTSTTSVENTSITPVVEVNNNIQPSQPISAPIVEKKVVHITELPNIPEEKAKTKFCDNCGTMIIDETSICPNCGEPIN